MSKFTKIVAVSVLVIAAVVAIAPAKAQTADELKAQVAQLQAALAALQGQLGSSTTGSTSAYTFTQNLTIGSKGADVTALQNFLASKGFLTATARGYFGALTKAALAKYQASVGITPASGYFGQITRAQLNQVAVVTPTPTTTGTPTPTTTGTPSTGSSEGVLTVDLNPAPAAGTKVYEGNTDVAVLGLKIKAQNSNITIQRVKVGLGTDSTIYSKVLTSLAAYDGSTLLNKVALNSSTVTKENSNYYVYFNGLNFVVPKDTTKVLTIKADVMGTIDTAYSTGHAAWNLTVPANGVRGIDTAGINQYSSSDITNSFIAAKSLSTNATLTVSKNSNSPKATAVVANTVGDVNAAPIMAFDLKAQDDMAKVDQMVLTFTGSATETVAYLYDGSSLIQSASVIANRATFTNMQDAFQVPQDTTKTITVKVDYSGATTADATSTVSLSTTGMIAYKGDGTSYSPTGSADSDTMHVTKLSPVFALTSANATWSPATFSGATGTMTGTFSFSVTAKGGDIYLATSSPIGAFELKLGGASTITVATSSIAYQDPSGITANSNGYYKIAQDTTANFTVTATVPANTASFTNGNNYMYVNNVIWSANANGSSPAFVNYLSDTFKTNYVNVIK